MIRLPDDNLDADVIEFPLASANDDGDPTPLTLLALTYIMLYGPEAMARVLAFPA